MCTGRLELNSCVSVSSGKDELREEGGSVDLLYI